MINKQLTYLLSLASLIMLSLGCNKKDLPDIPYENNPVFNVDGTINNETISLHAGQNNAFMLSKVEKLNGVDQFTGRLSDGNISMGIRIFDTNIDIPTLVGNFVELPKYNIGENYGSNPLLKISKEDFSNGQVIDYLTWTVNGLAQSNSTLSIYEPGKYNICVTTHFYTGEKATACNSITVGYKSNADFILSWEIIQNEYVKAIIEAPNNLLENVKWYIDDVYLQEELVFNEYNIPNKFRLKAEVRFQNGVVAEREVFVNKSSYEYSIRDLSIIGEKSTLKWDSSVLFTVEMNGITYQSMNGAAAYSTFDITDISNYTTSHDGSESKAKLLKGTLDSPFLNTATGAIVNGTFQIEIGVGY